MTRPPRLHVPGGYYHAMLRGNHREPLFGTHADRHVLNNIVGDAVSRGDAHVHAFCWMTNHLHLLVQVDDRPLGSFMKRIAMRYSRYRHRTLETTGHLFERRYRARLVDVDAYFLVLLRYIHLNPVKAGVVADPLDYPWSSHRAFLGKDTIPWLTTTFGLALFSRNVAQARAAYARFLADPEADDSLEDSLNANDTRVLGDDRFVERLRPAYTPPRSEGSLERLAKEICARHEVALGMVRSRASHRSLTTVRLQILDQALAHRVATLSEVARFLRRDPSTLLALKR